MYDTKNVKECLDLVFVSAGAFKAANADGHIDAADIPQLIPVFVAAGPALKDLGEVPKELADLDTSEAEDLLAYAATKLPQVLEKASLVRKVNAALKVVVALVQCVAEFKKEDVVHPVASV